MMLSFHLVFLADMGHVYEDCIVRILSCFFYCSYCLSRS